MNKMAAMKRALSKAAPEGSPAEEATEAPAYEAAEDQSAPPAMMPAPRAGKPTPKVAKFGR